MRITVDTNVLISALGWDGPEAIIMEEVIEGGLILCISDDILGEFYRVVKYPKFGFTDEETDNYVGMFIQNAIHVKPGEKIKVITEDPVDNIIIECAVAGKCSYIISGDRHLLKLGQYEEITILNAANFLKSKASIENPAPEQHGA